MILLHRLSYLKYNNFLPNSKFVKIITPNKEFSLFINNLANSLELEDVEVLGLELEVLFVETVGLLLLALDELSLLLPHATVVNATKESNNNLIKKDCGKLFTSKCVKSSRIS